MVYLSWQSDHNGPNLLVLSLLKIAEKKERKKKQQKEYEIKNDILIWSRKTLPHYGAG